MPDTLENLINGALIPAAFPPGSRGQNFAPKSTLKLITELSVLRTFWPNLASVTSLGKADRDLVEFISTQAQEIFAIGICMNISKRKLKLMMQRFMTLGKADINLPISNSGMNNLWDKDRGSRRSFEDSQHFFRPYDFPKQAKYSVVALQPNEVLPVLKSSRMSEGHFGIVYKVKLHEESLNAHHPIRKTQCWAAIKRLQASNEKKNARKAWDREVKALQRICQLDLQNVVEIAAMMTIETQPYFVFPWAHGGNLRDFWKKNNGRRSNIVRRHIPEIIEQLVGLAAALEKLHAFQNNKAASYRHGDLKPENILVFDNDKRSLLGVWKLTDLGLARYHMKATGDRHYVTSNSGAGTISYQPPESIKRAAPATTRLYDIWGMGCIILQLMTWLIYGKSRVDELTKTTTSVFMDRQSSYWNGAWTEEKGFHNVKIHSNVKSLMSQMKDDIGNSKALQNLLSIIEGKLLVVRLPRRPQ